MSRRERLGADLDRARELYARHGMREVARRARLRVLRRPDSRALVALDALPEFDQYPSFPLLDHDAETLARVRAEQAAWHADGAREIRSATWVLPRFSHAYFGGVFTILRFVEGLQAQGVDNRILVYDAERRHGPELRRAIAEAWPTLCDVPVTAGMSDGYADGEDPLAHMEPSDIGISTFWMSSYALLRSQRIRGRYAFVQDFEPLFYPAGSASALAENSYRWGFDGIVNTPGLADAYRAYGNPAVSFIPAVDREHYHPPAAPRPTEPIRIVFYGRAGIDRNAFGLGLAALSTIKQQYGERVDIVSVGEEWKPRTYGVNGLVRNLGLLPGHAEVAELYRSAHVGLVFMLTKHPSYQPLEFMASGVATVTNRNESNTWLFRDGENALVAEPTVSSVAEQIARLVEDAELRERIAVAGVATVADNSWQQQIDRVWSALQQPGPLADPAS